MRQWVRLPVQFNIRNEAHVHISPCGKSVFPFWHSFHIPSPKSIFLSKRPNPISPLLPNSHRHKWEVWDKLIYTMLFLERQLLVICLHLAKSRPVSITCKILAQCFESPYDFRLTFQHISTLSDFFLLYGFFLKYLSEDLWELLTFLWTSAPLHRGQQGQRGQSDHWGRWDWVWVWCFVWSKNFNWL